MTDRSTSLARCGLAFGFLICWLALPGCSRLWAQSDERQIANLEQAAVTAQNRGDYSAAAEFWTQLLKEFPNLDRRGEVLHNSGLCQAKLGNYAVAAQQLQQAIDELDVEAVESRARAHLYLGFSHLELGKAAAGSQPEQSRVHFETAADVFRRQLDSFPKYSANHEALYFQGMAYERLGRPADAAAAYQSLVDNPQATFYLDGLFALGYAFEQQSRWNDARTYYLRFLNECGEHASADEARLRAGEVAWQLARDAESRADVTAQESFLKEAVELLAEPAANPEFAMRDAAIYRLGWMAFQANAWQRAGELFEAVADMPESVLAGPAALLAGRAWIQTESWNQAKSRLESLLDGEPKLAVEAAHWLAQSELRQQRPEAALALAETWIPKSANSPIHIELLMDRAEAAAAIPAERQNSIAYYQDVAAADPQHRLAPIALYQAAFSLLESGQGDRAVELCRAFQTDYPQHDYLPDVLEVWADASLAAERYDEARQLFEQMAERQQHPKQAQWKMRSGVAAFFQKRFDECEAILTPIAAAGLGQAALDAEVHYWLGCSQLEQKKHDQAAASFQQALAAAENWPRAAEASLFLVQSLLGSQSLDPAEQALTKLWADFPQSPQAAEAAYRFSEMAATDRAVPWLRGLVERFPQSPLAPPALLTLGRKLHAQGELQSALEAFQQLTSSYPEYEHQVSARIEAASLLRQMQQPDQARQALEGLLTSLPRDHAQWFDAQYELALAEIAARDFAAAIPRLQSLLSDDRGSQHRDRVRYELAWAARDLEDALREQPDTQQNRAEIERLASIALDQFRAITREHASSPVAADAWFQVAQRDYAAADYESAREGYLQAIESAGSDERLREKSLYKLGWTHFRLEDYDAAQQAFGQQLQDFPEGSLRADGLFMVSECLFAQKNFAGALQAYRVAKPAISESGEMAAENRWFAALHAAQAANQTKDYQGALEFADELARDEAAPDTMRCDAWLEIGNAHLGLKDVAQAVEAWRHAATDLGKTGVRAACLIGDALFAEKKFEDAIQQFKLVLYGYGGTERDPEIDPWKAFAAYETARCYHVQIADAPESLRPQLMDKSIEFFQYLVDHYGDSELAGEARTQLEKLRKSR